MRIERLRLTGFKSFVEPTDLIIEPGLTGVVGPNGCGKSNLLEALRWVMGETSYKSMRASSMEDVIFSGTDRRPQREAAEVLMLLDNRARKAPSEFNESDEIEVIRRIERQAGSAYRINGRDARARDVRLLFEDAATGARSPALVRQGQIAEIVNAKPQARRRILEDAAGVAGLHSRRHEAELRLKAAEGNLARVHDVIGQIVSQINGLKRQARQAKRYRQISAEIRKAEALHHYALWARSQVQVDEAEATLRLALEQLGAVTQIESEAILRHNEAAQCLPDLRDEEATRGAVLHRLNVELETLDREEARALERRQELQDSLAQLERDVERERSLVAEAASVHKRLSEELRDLLAAAGDERDEQERLNQAKEQAGRARDVLEGAEAEANRATAKLAEANAERLQCDRQIAALTRQLEEVERRIAVQQETLAELQQGAPEHSCLADLESEAVEAGQRLAHCEAGVAEAEEEVRAAAEREREARDASTAAQLACEQRRTEITTLRKLLDPAGGPKQSPVVDSIEVEAGYETALGAALGEDLEADLSEQAPAHWRTIAVGELDPELPSGLRALADVVTAPEQLRRRLAQVAIVDTIEDGHRLIDKLQPGQRLVSEEGDLWRWDGFVARADAPTPAARRLAERNRLSQLEADYAQALRASEDAQEAANRARDDAATAKEREMGARAQLKDAQSDLTRLRSSLSEARAARQRFDDRYARLNDGLADYVTRQETLRADLADCRQVQANLADSSNLEAALEAARAKVTGARDAYALAQAELANIEREQRQAREGKERLTGELGRWEKRRGAAEGQVGELERRIGETARALETSQGQPELVAARRAKLHERIAQAERERAAAGDRLAEGETKLRELETVLRSAQSELTLAREERARVEARLEAARERRSVEARAIREAFDCAPQECLEIAEVAEAGDVPEVCVLESNLQRLRSERERLGGVNLRAEEELERLDAQATGLEAERSDLENAISELRSAIHKLNREGRRRLLEAFEEVNQHFARLFETLFGGGGARLELVESDDPLESGLEIVANPPGKKPNVLSLLSGGEQTLTALSLIFAVFLTNPSPICVLDEVDAPLDDANVDRFCTMMERMASETDTRFLVITHHPMTMARMDRLFGVTMAERGVSQLVSVDLRTAEAYREAS